MTANGRADDSKLHGEQPAASTQGTSEFRGDGHDDEALAKFQFKPNFSFYHLVQTMLIDSINNFSGLRIILLAFFLNFEL